MELEDKTVCQTVLKFFSLKGLYLPRQNFCFKKGHFSLSHHRSQGRKKKDSIRHFQARSAYKTEMKSTIKNKCHLKIGKSRRAIRAGNTLSERNKNTTRATALKLVRTLLSFFSLELKRKGLSKCLSIENHYFPTLWLKSQCEPAKHEPVLTEIFSGPD